MIYERPDQRNNSVGFSHNKSSDLPSQSIISYDIKDLPISFPSRVSKRKIKNTMRLARRNFKSAKKNLVRSVFVVIFCISVCSTILCLSLNGIYLPDSIPNAFAKIVSQIYDATIVTKAPALLPKDKGPLSYEVQADPPSSSSADMGEKIPHFEQTNPDLSTQIQASDQSFGKAGVDGQVYSSLLQKDLSCDNLDEFFNQTNYNTDNLAYSLSAPSSLENITDISQPLVLILHTHATECYSQSAYDNYETSEPTRTSDTSKNVVRVGEQIVSTLSSFGINALHDTHLHDEASFINAYSSSFKSVKSYLEKYPSLRFVIDVHRDAIIYDDNSKIKPICSIAGQNYAQLMFVVGTDQSSSNHPNWKDNLSLSQTLRRSLMDMYPSICRKTNIRNVSFNQQLSSGYLLLEVGSCGNTLSEALTSADAFATVLAQTIIKSM